MIQVYNRKTNNYEVEKVAGGNYIKWSYDSPVGKSLTELLVKKKLFSKLYGAYCDTSLSKKKISNFIKDFDSRISKTFFSKGSQYAGFVNFLSIDSAKDIIS